MFEQSVVPWYLIGRVSHFFDFDGFFKVCVSNVHFFFLYNSFYFNANVGFFFKKERTYHGVAAT